MLAKYNLWAQSDLLPVLVNQTLTETLYLPSVNCLWLLSHPSIAESLRRESPSRNVSSLALLL